jgi:predicted nucleic acid-binding protein
MSVALLDVNVLLALSDPMHIHHEAAHRWFAARGASHPNYPNRPGDVPVVLSLLRQLCAAPGHVFWPDAMSLLTILRPDVLLTHGHVTDVYLLGLAVAEGGRLATFDRRIPAVTVPGGTQALEVIDPL